MASVASFNISNGRIGIVFMGFESEMRAASRLDSRNLMSVPGEEYNVRSRLERRSRCSSFMKIIPTSVHGVLDYIVGLALLAAPNIFGFANGPTSAVWIPRILGIIVLLQAICTDYELGLAKLIPWSMHRMDDFVAGLFLAASPWLFGFNKQPNNVWMPHLIVGLFIFLSTLMTDTQARGTAADRR